MGAFASSIALFVNRANSKAAELSLESVDAFIFGKVKLARRLVRDVYQLEGAIRAVGVVSTLTAFQKLRIAQRLTKCYSLDKLAFLENAPYSPGNPAITLQYGERLLDFTQEGAYYFIYTNRQTLKAPVVFAAGSGLLGIDPLTIDTTGLAAATPIPRPGAGYEKKVRLAMPGAVVYSGLPPAIGSGCVFHLEQESAGTTAFTVNMKGYLAGEIVLNFQGQTLKIWDATDTGQYEII